MEDEDDNSRYHNNCFKILKIFDNNKKNDQYLNKIIYYDKNGKIIKIEYYEENCVFEESIKGVKGKRSFCEEFLYDEDGRLKKYEQTKYNGSTEKDVEYYYSVDLYEKKHYKNNYDNKIIDPYIKMVTFYTKDPNKCSFIYNTSMLADVDDDYNSKTIKINVYPCEGKYDENKKKMEYTSKISSKPIGNLTYKVDLFNKKSTFCQDKNIAVGKIYNNVLEKNLEINNFFSEKTEYKYSADNNLLKEEITFTDHKDSKKNKNTIYDYKYSNKSSEPILLKKKNHYFLRWRKRNKNL